MALVSPGVEVTVIDESQYIPSAVNTVPYFLIATAQNKVSAAGVGVAAGTLAANANKTFLITSQRDLAATFGVPFFYNTTTGTPINGYELNEYGLLAAYSALGITNRAYVQRADVNLTELTASLSRPVGAAANGTWWLDTSTTVWGLQVWNASTGTFTNTTPLVITNPDDTIPDLDVTTGFTTYVPLDTVGSIGDYAVVAYWAGEELETQNVGWFKTPGNPAANVTANTWVIIGSDEWKNSWPTVTGTAAPTSLTPTANMFINGIVVAVPGAGTLNSFVAVINASMAAATQGIRAANINGKLNLYADSTADNDGSTADGGIISIQTGGTFGAALLTALGITATEFYAPYYFIGYSYQAPRWGSSQAQPRPTGSIWNNASPVNNGLSLKMKQWNTALGVWVAQTTNAFVSTEAALLALDPSGGGRNISVGTTIAQWNANYFTTTPNESFSFEILEKLALGQTIVTATATNPVFTTANAFTISASAAGTTTLNTGTATIVGTTVADFVAAVSAANVPFVSATVSSGGNLVLVHSQGGVIYLENTIGTPLTTAGFSYLTPLCRVSSQNVDVLVLSTFVTAPEFTFTASDVGPDQNPADGRLWYYSEVDDVDIMIQNNGAWVGYQNVANDVRGFDLTLCNATGPIVSATAPLTQTNLAESPLELGDLWINTSDLENYPDLYRWEQVSGVNQWISVDTTDQVSQNGILFADARWAPNGSTDPITDPIPTIVSLLTSDYLDLDASNPALYPEGMLLFNTRRSGYNVKSFQLDYFNGITFPDDTLPAVTNTWLTASGNKSNGSMYAGRLAQRQMVVEALKSGIDTSLGAREDITSYSLVATPAYPELIPNMIALSNERNNTLFVVGDTPMRLAGNGNDLVAWATNNSGLGISTEDGQIATSNFAATFYPSCQTTDLGGNLVVQPPSHMMVRTMIRSDEVSYPWLAPAGTRRGVVDNALQLGFIAAATGEFQPLSVNQALRDILYEQNVNPITFVNGVGITNFGNKTSRAVTTALDRINVARLVAFLRGRLEEIGKLYLFEPNDQITRNEITNTCNSLMIDLISKRAIYDYLVVCDLSNNTPARIDRNELYVDIAIEPVKSIEFIYIPLRIKNTGELSGGA